MSGTATPGTPVVEESTGVAPSSNAGVATPGSKPPAATPPASKEPDIYDAAFVDYMGPEAKDPESAPSSEHHKQVQSTPPEQSKTTESQDPAKAGDGTAEAPKLSDDQVQTLRRQHIEPEMVNGWSEAQRTAFFENANKREADQTTSYKQLSEQLDALTQKVGQGGKATEPEGGKPGEPTKETPGGEFVDQAKRVSEQLVDVYGEEFKPAGELLIDLSTKLNDALAQIETQGSQAKSSESGSQVNSQVIVELTLDNAVSGLVGDYPSLSKDAVRKQVLDRFETEWKSADSTHRNGKGPILPRIKKAVADAAKFELGTTTETAAQVALDKKNKQRLSHQPTPGYGRGQEPAKTEDQQYDVAFNEILKPEIRRS